MSFRKRSGLVLGLVVAGATACVVDVDEAGDEAFLAEEAALSGCGVPPQGSGSVCDLGGGQRRFQVTLFSGQQYVELFVRQNGIQNVAVAIQRTGLYNGDGTTTFALDLGGYAAGDAIEYRFYSYRPSSPGVFTPGPAEQVWYRAVGSAGAADVPVARDAAVIYSSYGTGPVPDRNFGSAPSVDIGEYHLTSEGLFGFALAGVPAGATVTRAELVIAGAYAPGGQVVTQRLNRVTSPWSEATVTWNSKPSYQLLREVEVVSGGTTRLDVTAEVAAALASGEISFALQPSMVASTMDNVFIDAREKVGGAPTSLHVEWR